MIPRIEAWLRACSIHTSIKALESLIEADPSILDIDTREELEAAREALERLLTHVAEKRAA